MPDANETMSRKITLMIIDKVLLGGGIALAGGIISIIVSHMQTVWSLQDKVFDKRFQAYSEMAQQADNLLSAVDGYYYDIPYTTANTTIHQSWQADFSELKSKFDTATGRSDSESSGSAGGDIPTSFRELVSQLESLEQMKNKYRFLNPESINTSYNSFMSVIVAAMNEQIESIKVQDPANKLLSDREKEKDRQQSKMIHDAYNQFLNELRGALGLTVNPYRPYQLTPG